MGRLGYMRASARAGRRRAVRRWMHRGAMAIVAGIALGVGIYTFNQSPDARRPVDTPIHEAFEQDLQRQTQGVRQVLSSFRELKPLPPPVLKPGNDDPVEASEPGDGKLPIEAKAPFRWI